MKTLDSFRLFLDGIKKERTTVVNIDYWNRLMNECQLTWLKNKAPKVELTQDIIDDLSVLRVVTDGSQTWKGKSLEPIGTIKTISKEFYLPTNTFLVDYPRYFRLLSIQFLMSYYDTEIAAYRDAEDLEYARVLRSDKRAVMASNYYRRAKKGRLYYEIVGNSIRAVSEEDCIGKLMRLEYLRYPELIWLDEKNMEDHKKGTNGQPYVSGWGSIPCELGDIQTKEIIETAISVHLERTMDQRFQTFAQEQQINKQ